MNRTRRAAWPETAFTLIELLIVVAILAILAAVAVPNFLEAQTRSKVSREMNDMRAIASALEAYHVDYGEYPPHGELIFNASGAFVEHNYPATKAGVFTVEYLPAPRVTTPIAYISTVPEDIMLKEEFQVDESLSGLYKRYGYIQSDQMMYIFLSPGKPEALRAKAHLIPLTYGGWRLYGAGPDGDKARDTKTNVPYDPTNGTISDGDIIRSQRMPVMNLTVDE